MANYYGTGRTNYVKVKDEAAFREAVEHFAEVVEKDGRFALLDNNDNGGGWLLYVYDEAIDDYKELDLLSDVAPHLEDGEVMVFVESGAEKYRYVDGWAMAFNNKGEHERITLHDIYDKAKKLGPNITEASY